jgi:hypothetical protein
MNYNLITSYGRPTSDISYKLRFGSDQTIFSFKAINFVNIVKPSFICFSAPLQ